MRQERTVQASLFDLFADHEIGRELKAMSQWLDEHRELNGLAAEDLRRQGVKETGRQGLPAESVLRCGLLKQHRQLSYEELAFHLEDSASFRAFARLPLSWTPKKGDAAHDNQRHPGRDVGSDQSHPTHQRAAGETRDRQGRAARQYGCRRAHARAERQLSSLGWGARDGAAVEGGRHLGWRSRVAQPSARRQETGARDRICPRSADPAPTLS